MSKTSTRRPGTGYADGYDGIDWGEREPPKTPCSCAGKGCEACVPTEDGPGQDEAAPEPAHVRFLEAVAASNGARVALDICHVDDSNGRKVWAAMQERFYVDCIGSQQWLLTGAGASALAATSAEVKTHSERRRFDREGA